MKIGSEQIAVLEQQQGNICRGAQQISLTLQQGDESRPLEVEYYPVNGTFNLHYFPYYGKKAQVGATYFSFNFLHLLQIVIGQGGMVLR